MVTIGLSSSVYRTHGAGHRLWCSFGNLLLLLWWLELARVGVFYYENREQFRSLKLPHLASQTIEAFPDGFELTVHKPSPGTHPTLSINRELPFSLPLPAWCGTVMSLLLGHMSRTNLSAEDAAELLPVPRILFTTERGLRELGGEARLLHLVLTETRTHASASRTLTLAPDLALASTRVLTLAFNPCPSSRLNHCPRPKPHLTLTPPSPRPLRQVHLWDPEPAAHLARARRLRRVRPRRGGGAGMRLSARTPG